MSLIGHKYCRTDTGLGYAMKDKTIRLLALILSISISALLSLYSRQYLSETGPRWPDDQENIKMAYNLYKYGVLSVLKEDVRPLKPSCQREPVTPLSLALVMCFHPGYRGEWTLEALMHTGQAIKILKTVNIGWLFLCLLGAWWAVRLLGGSLLFSSIAVLLVYAFGFIHAILDYCLTEIPTSSLLIWSGVFLILAYKRKRPLLFFIAGIPFGLLALTKASFYYVFLPIPFIFSGILIFEGLPKKQCLLLPAILFIGFGFCVYPYMLRNYYHFNQFKIAARGGQVLLIRAYQNDMTWTEVKGAFYYWAPQGFQPIIGAALGFSEKDLMKGGVLQRFNRHMFDKRLPSGERDPISRLATLGIVDNNHYDPVFAKEDQQAVAKGRPEDAISFIYKMSAERRRTYNRYKASGAAYPYQEADRELQKKAIAMIKERPFRHLALTPLYLWRGIGEVHHDNPCLPPFARGSLFRSIMQLIFFVCLYTFPFIFLYRRRFDAFLFILPTIGILLFYALFSHNILRYSVPAYPIMIIAFCMLTLLWAGGLYARLRPLIFKGQVNDGLSVHP